MNRPSRQSGFTLIEVMVALMVVAIALPALMVALYQQVDASGYMREKAVAQWVASNKLVETRIQVTSTGKIFKGRRSGVATMAGRDWYWWLEAKDTTVADFHRLEVSVAAEEGNEDQPMYTLIAFISVAQALGDVGGAPGAEGDP